MTIQFLTSSQAHEVRTLAHSDRTLAKNADQMFKLNEQFETELNGQARCAEGASGEKEFEKALEKTNEKLSHKECIAESSRDHIEVSETELEGIRDLLKRSYRLKASGKRKEAIAITAEYRELIRLYAARTITMADADDLNKTQIIRLAEERGYSFNKSSRKADILAAVKEQFAAEQEWETTPAQVEATA